MLIINSIPFGWNYPGMQEPPAAEAETSATSPNNDPEVVMEWTEPAQGGSRLDKLRSRTRRVGAAIRLLTDGIS